MRHGLLAALIIAGPTWGHHSAVIFDTSSTVAFSGTVTQFDWTNPHVYVFVEATSASGQTEIWQLEADATSILARSGWAPDSLEVGDVVTIRANPDRDPARAHGLLISIATPDGIVLTPRAGGRAASVGADSIEGTWDGLYGFTTRRYDYGELTAKGRAAQAAYDEADNPTSQCIAFPLPTIISAPYLYQIELLDDRVLIRSEIFNTERTIFTDGRGHPADGERTHQGHSIGRWEGDVLVVETTQFADNPAGNRNGIAAGAQKRVTERYDLSDDGRQLSVEFVVEDPEYLADPMVGGITWEYAPEREFAPFGCDPEIAKRYTFE